MFTKEKEFLSKNSIWLELTPEVFREKIIKNFELVGNDSRQWYYNATLHTFVPKRCDKY